MIHASNRKRHFLILALTLFTVVIVISVSGCGVQQFKSPMYQPNDYSGLGPNGLTWNGRDLILGDRSLIIDINSIETGLYIGNENKFNSDGFYMYARDPEPITSMNPALKNIKICGLAWEGDCCGKGFLWIADGHNKEIIKLDAYNKVIKQLPSPGDSPDGLAFDGKYLWVSDSKDSKIYKVSTEDGNVLSEYNSPIKIPTGLAWDCNNLWIIGMDTCKSVTKDCYKPRLVKLDVSSGMVTEEIDLPKPIVRPASLEWVNGVMWIGDYPLNRVFKISADGSAVKDDTVYASPITPKPRKIAVKEMPRDEREKLEKEDAKIAAEEAKPAIDAAKKSADEAKKAADEAKDAARKAEDAAKKSEKAFELQQKK